MAAPAEQPKINFAAAATKATTDAPIKCIEMSSMAVLKIAKHCSETTPALATGQLLGLDIGCTLEVTDCFPFPSEEEDESAGSNYQLDMMRCLRDVNVDNNTVGWYQSTVLGAYQTVELIETFISYQESIKRCVCVVYDPARADAGGFGLKAIRLAESFAKQYRDSKMTAKELKQSGVGWADVFEEIPLKVTNSTLVSALAAAQEAAAASAPTPAPPSFKHLSLSAAPFLERNLEFLNDCLDDIAIEQNKVSQYHRNVARQQQQFAQWLAKRKQENAQKRAVGEEPLPEEDPQQFKPIPEPTQLVTYLITNQVANYTDQISNFAGQSLQKLFLVDSLQAARE